MSIQYKITICSPIGILGVPIEFEFDPTSSVYNIEFFSQEWQKVDENEETETWELALTFNDLPTLLKYLESIEITDEIRLLTYEWWKQHNITFTHSFTSLIDNTPIEVPDNLLWI